MTWAKVFVITIGVRSAPKNQYALTCQPKGGIPLRSITFKYGMLVVISLVALRLVIGWHFFKEGAKKFTDRSFTADPFLHQSVGPMADLYQGMIADPYGFERLDKEKTARAWNDYREKVLAADAADEATVEEAVKLTETYVKQFEGYLDSIDEDLEKFHIKFEQWQATKKSPMRYVPHQQDLIEKQGLELLGMVSPWLRTVERMREEYRFELLELVLKEDTAAVHFDDVETSETSEISEGVMPIADPSDMPLINAMVKWTVVLVGVFLLLGLFTRLWAIVGAGFLVSVISSQWPGWPGATPTYYQAVELFALLVLCATSAGRYAGLDFFVCPKIQKCLACFRQGSNESGEPAEANENVATNQETSAATPSPADAADDSEPSSEDNSK